MPDRRCLVAVCCNQPTIFRKTAQSLMELGWGDRIPYAKKKHGFDSVVHAWFTDSPRVDMLRNRAASQAIKDGFSHVLFLDADMVWPTTVVADMLAHHDKGIVAGLYVIKGPPYGPAHLLDRFEERGVNMFHRANEFDKELVPVEVVGMGCTLIPTQAFVDIGERDWFEYRTDAEGWPVVSEDVPFCLRAAERGYAIYMDPSIKCGHVGVQVYDHRFHRRYQDSIEASKDKGPLVTMNAGA